MPMVERNGRIDSPQIHHIRGAKVIVQNLAVPAGSATLDATTAISAVLGTSGRYGTGVPVIPSPAQYREGVVTKATADYKIKVVSNVGKNVYEDGGEEVYARLAEAGGTYTLEFYTLDDAGAENAYTFVGAEAIDFCFGYRFKFEDQPDDIDSFGLTLNDDPSAPAPTRREALSVTAVNTVSVLSKTPIDLANIVLDVNGQSHYPTHGHFTVAGTTLTRDPAQAGFDLQPGYDLFITYMAF